jgi:hypothetical protein
MQAPLTMPAALPRRVRLLLEIGWAVIVAKCLAVPWMITRWQIPVHPGWVIVPTLMFAALVTFLALKHREP